MCRLTGRLEELRSGQALPNLDALLGGGQLDEHARQVAAVAVLHDLVEHAVTTHNLCQLAQTITAGNGGKLAFLRAQLLENDREHRLCVVVGDHVRGTGG